MANVSVIKLKVRRGTDAQRQLITLDQGEIGFTTDTKRLFVGDGTTRGGWSTGSKFYSTSTGIANATPTSTDLLYTVQTGDIVYDYSTSTTNFYILTGSSTSYNQTSAYVPFKTLLTQTNYIGTSANTYLVPLSVVVTNTPVLSNQALLSIFGASQGSTYSQIRNITPGLSASTDITIYNDNGIAYFDLGITSSVYNGNAYTPAFTVTQKNDSYAYSVSGNLVIGTSTANIGDLVMFTGGTLSGTAAVGGNERLRIANTGNVGIGTSAPSQLLTVAGNISATGTIYSGQGVLGGGSNSPYTYTNSLSNAIKPISGANIASGTYSLVAGGSGNNVSGNYSLVAGGCGNKVSNNYSFIGGGIGNTESSNCVVIGGGVINKILNASDFSFIGGGYLNTISGGYGIIVGGCLNGACNYSALVIGGGRNTASGNYSLIVNGTANNALSAYDTVINGSLNTASGYYSLVGNGMCNTASGCYSFIASGSANDTKKYSNTYILGTSLSANKANTTFVNNLSVQGTSIANATWVNSTYTGVSGDGVLIDYLQGSPGLGRISVGNGTGADSLAFYNNGPGLSTPTSTMYLSSNGFVGINTTTPGTVLTVNGAISSNSTFSTSVPVVSTGTYIIQPTTSSVILTGATVVTLPTPSVYPGRWLTIKNAVFAATITSASTNVISITGFSGNSAPGTIILPQSGALAQIGKWVQLQSDGTNWVAMAAN